MIMPGLIPPPRLVIRLWCCAWEVMDCAYHSFDLSPSDFHLCGACKKHVSVKKFATDARVRQAVTFLTLIVFTLCHSGEMLKCHFWLLHKRYYMYHLLPMYCVYMDERIKLLASEHLLPDLLKLIGMCDLSNRDTLEVYTALPITGLKSLIWYSRCFY
jgi:hypothetical protein